MNRNGCMVLYGTQTGTAEDLATELQEKLSEAGVAARAENMFDVSIDTLDEIDTVLVIVSTWGDGDPPDDAEDFHEALSEKAAGSLAGLHFSVLALGDTGYEYFCKCGIDFDTFLENAGAVRIVDRVDCDIDFEDNFQEWAEQVTQRLSPATTA